jgi:hypothetical protein
MYGGNSIKLHIFERLSLFTYSNGKSSLPKSLRVMEDKMKQLTNKLELPILKYKEMEDIIIQITEHKSYATLRQV